MHCLDCGAKLNTLNYTESVTKYHCETCACDWFQSRKIVVEWTKKPAESTAAVEPAAKTLRAADISHPPGLSPKYLRPGEKGVEHALSWQRVFNSQRIWPANWLECLERARLSGYVYVGFNGTVYHVGDTDRQDPICSDEDLR